MPEKKLRTICSLSAVLICCAQASYASNSSPFLTGPLGLNTVPSSRMDQQGELRFGVSTSDPYAHSFIGVQLANPLYISLRQSAEISSLGEDAKRLFPGLDFKLRLMKESENRPEISLGVQSAIGHKRMAGEYLAASKRYRNMDFTLGLGWGRFGSSGHIKNPLRVFGSHFDGSRDFYDEETNDASNWFSGDSVGIFGGVEYFLSVEGLSLKLDYNADDYLAERRALSFERPSPWSLGLSYDYKNHINASLGVTGTDKIMGRLSFNGNARNWPLTSRKSADKHNPVLNTDKDNNLSAVLQLDSRHSAPEQIGKAGQVLAENSEHDGEAIEITPFITNLRGPKITLLREDIKKAAIDKTGSPQEIWQNTEFTISSGGSPFLKSRASQHIFTLGFEQDISLSEEDHGVLYRSSLLAKHRNEGFLGFLNLYQGVRFNIADNLELLGNRATQGSKITKGDIDDFSDSMVTLDHAYLNYNHSLSGSLHAGLSAGYLEEFYLGAGAELLYRPFASRFALGGQIWNVVKRDPDTALNLGWGSETSTTGHLGVWYDLPYHDVTINAQAGRFLAGDTGVKLGLFKTFENGAKISGDIVLSDERELDDFGNKLHAYHSIKLSLPLGAIPYIPEDSYISVKPTPLGRSYGQTIDIQSSLFELSEKISLKHIAGNFKNITE